MSREEGFGMTAKEFFGLAHNYDDSVIEEARKLLEDSLKQQNYTDIAVYIAEAHGGQEYEKIVADAAYYLPSQNTMMLLGA